MDGDEVEGMRWVGMRWVGDEVGGDEVDGDEVGGLNYTILGSISSANFTNDSGAIAQTQAPNCEPNSKARPKKTTCSIGSDNGPSLQQQQSSSSFKDTL
jgi:hypothetical protein